MFSIIVPIFRVEKYLPKCIESVLAQTYSGFELILVDDGSSDSCPSICDNYAAKDNRVKVIHKENGGVSSARNVGIEAAIGDYIMFVDADDYVAPTLCENLIRYADENTDIVISGYFEDFGKFQQKVKLNYQVNCTVENLKEDFDLYYRLLLLNSPCAKLYKQNLLRNIRFNDVVSMGEDFLFNLECYKRSKNIKFIPATDYYYNLSNISSATKKYKEEYLTCYIKCYEEGKKFKYGEIKFTNDSLDEIFCSNCLNFLQLIAYNIEDKREKQIKMQEVLENSYFNSTTSSKQS